MKVSGLDAHKDSIFCAIFDGAEYSEVKEYASMTNSIRDMGIHLKEEGVERIAMESTSIYWTPVWDILEEMGFDLILVNPFLIRQMPGRKSDVKDAQWIASLLHKGLLRGSMIPCFIVKELRIYTRKYVRLQQRTSQILTEMDRIMVIVRTNKVGNCVRH